jgi:hypothetical protein
MVKVYNVSRGETVSGGVTLYNSGNEAIMVKVSQADYVYNDRDEVYCIEPGKYERSNANWINFQNSVTVRPKQKVVHNFTVSTPDERQISGSYWSLLFFEQEDGFFPAASGDLLLGFRYGVQIVNNINHTGSVDLSFVDAFFEDNNVSLIVQNTGSLWISTEIKIEIFDEYATYIGSYIAEKRGIHPDLNKRIQIPITNLNRSNYYAVIIADCGNNKVFGHQMSFTVR